MSQVITAKDEMIFASARRVNEALTARMEKRALQWMAERAPKWVSSDQLTLMGLCAQVGAGICYALSRYNRYALLVVILCLALNWLGDSMDGTLARVRQQQRPALWILRGSHGGYLWSHCADVRTGLLRVSALADGCRDAGGVSAAFERELSGHIYS